MTLKKWIRSKSVSFWAGTSICICLFVFIGFYAYLQMKEVFNGVEMSASIERSGKVSKIVGKAKNATYIALNGREISVDKNGVFSENIVLPEGFSVVTVSAEDGFGQSKEKTIDIYTVNNQAVAFETHTTTGFE